MVAVPLAIAGGLLGIHLSGGTLNLYSQIGLVILVGIAAKNGILIVEFANQLRDRGMEFEAALLETSRVRLRPILMTGITAAASAIPLIFAFEAGAEIRAAIGAVMLGGVLVATLFTLFLVPTGYSLLARKTGSPGDVARKLEQESQLARQ
jgi:multidrug efflux pump